MARIGGLALGPGEQCYDPDHPWYLPNFLHDDLECACMAANPDIYPSERQCLHTFGDFAGAAASTPGWMVGGVANVVGQAAGEVGKGFWESANIGGMAVVAAAGVVAYFILSRR